MIFGVRSSRSYSFRPTFSQAVPGLVLSFLNRALAGTVTSQMSFVPAMHQITPRQIWDIVTLPLFEASGWAAIAWHAQLPSPYEWILGVPVLILIVALCWAAIKNRASLSSDGILLLVAMTSCAWLFLVCLTVLSGDVGQWTIQGRYGVPIAFGWCCLAVGIACRVRRNLVLAILLSFTLGIPFIVGLAAVVSKPCMRRTPTTLPRSRLAAKSPTEEEAYRRLYQIGVKELPAPELLIVNQTSAMNELCVGVIPWYRVEAVKKVHSSKPLTVWAMLDPASMAACLSKLDPSVHVIPQDTIDGCPWRLAVIVFE